MKRFGVSTHLFHGERLRREHLAAVAGEGFEAVELFATRSHFDYHDANTVAALAGWLIEARLEMPSVHAPIGGTIDEMRAALAIARIIPFRHFVVHLGAPDHRDAALRHIEGILQIAEPLGVAVALEVMDQAMSTPPALVDLIERDLDGMNVGICMDVGHAFMLGDVADAIETASEYLATTHLHDNHGRRDEHLLPFEGAIDWAATMMAFEKIGYDGVLMFEVRNTSTAGAVLERAGRARRKLEGLAAPWELEAESPS